MASTKFDINMLGKLLPNGLRECNTCGEQLCDKKFNFQRHYKRCHPDNSAPDGSLSYILVKSEIQTREDYLENVVTTMAENNLPWSFWSKSSVQRLMSGYSDRFDVKCCPKAMQAVLAQSAVSVRRKISEELKGKLLSVKLDLATRFDRNVLGISVQFIDKWRVCVRYLAVIEMERATVSDLRRVIEETLDVNGIDPSAIYSVTTDSGANVMRTSDELLDDIRLLVDEEEAELLKEEFDSVDETNLVTIKAEDLDVEEALDEVAKEFCAESTRCAAHLVQLAVMDYLKEGHQDFINEMKEVVKDVRKYMRNLPPSTDSPPLPSLANETQWGSTYLMVSTESELSQEMKYQIE